MNKFFEFILKAKIIPITIVIVFCFLVFRQFYLPLSFSNEPSSSYLVKIGMSENEIASTLESEGFITNRIFLKIYVFISGNHGKLKAGLYNLSPSMSIASIVSKISSGATSLQKATIIEGWSIKDMADYLDKNNIYNKQDFLAATQKDYRNEFDFLSDLPEGDSLEGYLFPDTYHMSGNSSAEEFVRLMLSNFDNKVSDDLKQEIKRQNKTVFEVVTMASLIEKEVNTYEDKRLVSGILYNRLNSGIPLQVDSTINYITGEDKFRISRSDTKMGSNRLMTSCPLWSRLYPCK